MAARISGARVEGAAARGLRGLDLPERGEVHRRSGTVLLAHLPAHIAEREVEVLVRQTGWDRSCFEIRQVESAGPGNAVVLELASAAVTEVVTAFGEVGVPAEAVADRAVQEMRRYLAAPCSADYSCRPSRSPGPMSTRSSGFPPGQRLEVTKLS